MSYAIRKYDLTPSSQDLFNDVVEHLFRQGGTSRIGAYSTCLYRGDDRCCAVGFLIPDETYDPKMEGRGVSDLIASFGPALPTYFQTHRALLARLQNIHDSYTREEACGYTFREHVLAKAIALAVELKLDWSRIMWDYGVKKNLPVLGRPIQPVSMVGEPSGDAA